jgi:hypothetical protein
MICTGHVALVGGGEKTCGKSEGKRPLRRLRRRREDKIKMDLGEMEENL